MLLRFAMVGGGLILLALIPALAVAVAKSSRRGILHCLAGEELLAAGWLIPAEREFRRALRLQPLLGAAHCGLAKIRLRQQRYDEAVTEYRAAIAALHKVDRSLRGTGPLAPTPVPETLVAGLAEALEQARRPEEAARLRRTDAETPAAAGF